MFDDFEILDETVEQDDFHNFQFGNDECWME